MSNPRVVVGNLRAAIKAKSTRGMPKRTKGYSALNRVIDAIEARQWEAAERLCAEMLEGIYQKERDIFLKKRMEA